LVHNNKRGVNPLAEDWETNAPIALRELGGLDEGIADIYGALDTKDPDFIAYSIGSNLVDRDMKVDRFYEQCLHMAVLNGSYPEPAACGGNYGEGVKNPTDSKGVRLDQAAGSEYGPHQLGAVGKELQAEQGRRQVLAHAAVQGLRQFAALGFDTFDQQADAGVVRVHSVTLAEALPGGQIEQSCGPATPRAVHWANTQQGADVLPHLRRAALQQAPSPPACERSGGPGRRAFAHSVHLGTHRA
jgi:hypothetical protein